MVEIYAVNVGQELPESEYEHLLCLVSEAKREKIKKRQNRKTSVSTLIGEILVRVAVMKRFGIENQKLQFQYREHGKPYLVGREDVFFNISHSGDWVVCAIGESEVGIDLERIKSNRVKVAKRFFTKEEYEDIMRQPEAQQASYFCKLWTLKECYLKWSGDGLSKPLDSFRFQPNEENSLQLKENELSQRVGKQPTKLNFWQFQIDCDYELSVCSTEEKVGDKVNIMDQEQLIRWMDEATDS